MSMLAGPRRKQKVINLRAKNNAWSNDTNKFGQRMLEKMGWCSGKGLGAKENGIVEHVVAKYKNDDRGLGFEDKNDQWTKHEDDFNALLANLSNADNNEEKLHSGVSLEVKSKKSKARIHYHKFTRGKDIARYSEKDLANIFGKKSLKNDEKIEEPVTEECTTEKVFTDKGSMEDYFKSKMSAFNSKSQLLSDSNVSKDDDADYGFQGFSSNDHELEDQQSYQGLGFQPFSFYRSSENNNEVNSEQIVTKVCTENVKEGRKKKKSKHQDNEHIENDSTETKEHVIENNSMEKVKKPKKKKIVPEPDFTEIKEHEIETESMEKVKKSKQKKIAPEPADDIEDIPKKKKSKKKCVSLEESIDNCTDQDIHIPKKKKKRKNKEM